MSRVVTGLAMAHDRDPGDVIKDAVGDVSGIELFHNWVLVGHYQRPEKTKGGIILAEATREEEQYQGTVAYVLAVGPAAFQDDENNKFFGVSVKPGDWVMFSNYDGRKMSINKNICRLLQDAHIKMRIPHPDAVF